MYGLPAMDGVPVTVSLYLISRWVLEHYRPLLESHGRTIYALPGVPPVSSLHLHLHQQPATAGVPFLGQACIWGDAPTFLSGPAEPPSGAQAVPARTTVVHGPQVTFTGWAGDLRAREPAREVVATFNGRIVARSTPDAARPDVPAAGYPAGFLRSGFRLSIPTWANASTALRVFAIGRDGSVAELPIPNEPAHGGVARIGSRTVALQPGADTGHIDTESASGALLQIEPPAGSTWSDYRWLEVDAPSFGGFLQGGFDLSDRPGATDDPGHVISFPNPRALPTPLHHPGVQLPAVVRLRLRPAVPDASARPADRRRSAHSITPNHGGVPQVAEAPLGRVAVGWRRESNRVEARLALAPPTPPDMRVRTGRFAQHSRHQQYG